MSTTTTPADWTCQLSPARPDSAPARGGVGQTAIRIRNLTKRFAIHRSWNETLFHPLRVGYSTVLHRLNCDIQRGEFFGLLGPNGAGKTTLLKILATLILPDDGAAAVEGYDVVREAIGVRGILSPVIADERSLHWRLSAYENLRLFAVLHGVRPGALDGRVADLLELVGLGEVGAKQVGAFSTGMKQRLLIARALLASPKVLLLDEPTRSLDPISARTFRVFLRGEISGRQGCTVLLATHNTEEAFELCDRVAILDQGKLLATGTPDALKEQFGDARYRLWTRDPEHPGFASLAQLGVICGHLVHGRCPEGWSIVEVNVPGGLTLAAQVLEFLISRGAVVGRCERVDLSLAELIERVLRRA